MEKLYRVHLEARPVNGIDGLADSIARLLSLRHRARSFVCRTYSFPGNVRAVARGIRNPIIAYSEDVLSESAGLVVTTRKNHPVPYLDWADAHAESTIPTTEVLITNKLSVLVERVAGEERVYAEVVGCERLEKHLSALESVCDAAGFDPPELGQIE